MFHSDTESEPEVDTSYDIDNDPCLNHLPAPFGGRVTDLDDQIATIEWSAEIPPEQKQLDVSRLKEQMRDVKRRAIIELGGYAKIKQTYLQVKKDSRLRRRNNKIVKNSDAIGINPSVAKKATDSNVIANVLLTRGEVEKLCSEPIGGFTPPLESRLDECFQNFVESSNKLNVTTPNTTLTAEIERVTQMFNQKKEELSSYKEDLAVLYGQKQKKNAKCQKISALEGVEVSCKTYCSCGPVKIALGPVINLEKGVPFNKSNINLGLDVNFDQFNIERESGIEVSLAAKQGRCEVGIESNLSKTGFEHSCTAKIHGFSNFSGNLRVPSKSFKQMLHPMNVVNHGELFVGCRLKRGRLVGNSRFGVLPVEKLKNIILSDVDGSVFDSGPFCFEEQDQSDLSSKERNQPEDLELVFKQGHVETTFSLAEVQQESNQQEELDNEEEQVSALVEGTNVRQPSQIAMSILPPQPSSFYRTSTSYEWLFPAVLLGFRFVSYIWELFCKFKNRDKGL